MIIITSGTNCRSNKYLYDAGIEPTDCGQLAEANGCSSLMPGYYKIPIGIGSPTERCTSKNLLTHNSSVTVLMR